MVRRVWSEVNVESKVVASNAMRLRMKEVSEQLLADKRALESA
jgi:hypothetical protein